ncbi:tripartite tricarboxylate transporter substrate binding protein [Polynucleobacter sp. 71A-WALBACH]|uniref:Bug family tripartite tricarboxylate transporter substrate binding protein n=1 Tax=Polynucleobacter sp. 71A-WALBACH TaxID=2689097 RepID=UPI001C0BC788|nr:tripartite tricarboxylate transporter substrate binding protein [Polynucleobacter sp. 71A-WALBACH]MBU3594235.1 tripartite tricarboxylate transporter substrate binding protein [Polynucleobacter sp. 71A-WALBACH]
MKLLKKGILCIGVLLGLIAGTLGGQQAYAQEWPDKPIKLIVPFAAGGSADILGRILAQDLGKNLGQNVVIENRGGAGGNIGAELVAKAPADGYTILLASGSMMTVNPFLYKKASINYLKDLTYITTIATVPMVIAVSPKLPVNTLAELITLAKTKELNFGSAGIGSQIHMANENFLYSAGIQATHVPYKGENPALNDLIAGQIDFMAGNYPATGGFAKAGQVKALAVTSQKRLKQLPNIPTVSEAAIPGFENTGWYALAVPHGTPQSIIDKIYMATEKSFTSSALLANMDANGLTPVMMKSKDVENKIRLESANWDKVIKTRNIPTQ